MNVNSKKRTHGTFYVSYTFATSKVHLLRSKHLRETFSCRYARLSIRTLLDPVGPIERWLAQPPMLSVSDPAF